MDAPSQSVVQRIPPRAATPEIRITIPTPGLDDAGRLGYLANLEPEYRPPNPGPPSIDPSPALSNNSLPGLDYLVPRRPFDRTPLPGVESNGRMHYTVVYDRVDLDQVELDVPSELVALPIISHPSFHRVTEFNNGFRDFIDAPSGPQAEALWATVEADGDRNLQADIIRYRWLSLHLLAFDRMQKELDAQIEGLLMARTRTIRRLHFANVIERMIHFRLRVADPNNPRSNRSCFMCQRRGHWSNECARNSCRHCHIVHVDTACPYNETELVPLPMGSPSFVRSENPSLSDAISQAIDEVAYDADDEEGSARRDDAA